MADPAQRALPRLGRPLALRPSGEGAAIAGIVVLAAVAGAAASRGGIPVVGITICVAACVVALVGSWRPLLVGLLLYLPFSGLPTLILYPDTGPSTLAKDFLFVIPAYVGAAAVALSRREDLRVPGAPVVLMGSLALLIVVQAFNPEVPKPLVALIGIKVWLFYIPLIWLGYHFTRRKEALQRLLMAMLAVAMVPCLAGIAEAVLVQTHGRAFVYGLYGPAAEAATQGFAGFGFNDGSALLRLPSIFEFVGQYWLFCTATIALGYAAWRGNRSHRLLRVLGPLAIGIAVLASMTTGLRAAFIFSPFLLLLIALLEGASLGRMLAYASGSIVAVVGALVILGVPAGPLAELIRTHTAFIFDFFGDGFTYAADHAMLGLGTGVDTNGISYAFGSSDDYAVIYATVGDVWWESWYLKAFLELGVVGLLLLLALLFSVIRRSLATHQAIVDPELRSMSAAFLALFVWSVIYALKTAYVDLDPMAIYLWFFLGVQWALIELQRGEPDARDTG